MEKNCAICKTNELEKELFEGVYDDEIVLVCKDCARDEHIPIIKKPTEEQLNKANVRYSVRERMEKLSGMRKNLYSKEQNMVRMNLSKLRVPEMKESNSDVVDNYYWEVNIARRRRKLTLNQLAIQTQIPLEIIESIEKGKIPTDYENIFRKLEDYLNIKILKKHEQKLNFNLNLNDEENILKDVREKMKIKKDNTENIINKKEQINKIKSGEIDFSKRDNLKDITLNDLVDLKRKKEKEEFRRKVQKQTEDLFGDDIEFA